jgi:phenylacetate-CoA ligase
MAALADKLYLHSPVAIQNLITSLYGLHLRHQRYGGAFRSHLAALMESQWHDAGQLRQLQVWHLRRLLEHACRRVQHYMEAGRQGGWRPEDISDLSDLRLLPTISKEDLRRDYGSFVAEGMPANELVVVNTSGTTGTPLQVRLTKDARRRNYAFFARSKLWAGVGLFERSATFAGRVLVSPGQPRPPYWRSNPFCNNIQFSSFHVSSETAPAYLGKLKAFRPALIDSYPSSLYALAKFMREQGRGSIRPKAIITSAETLLEHQRQLIEEVFGCRVFDQYGGAEQVAFICQCEHGAYHANPEYGIIEILNGKGQPVGPGELGEITATGFTNPALPLIRYRTGDMAAWSGQPCPCRRAFPVLERIDGRRDDILITRDGRYIGRLDPVFKGLGHTIAAAQIVQPAFERVVLKVQRDRGYQEAHGLKVVQELKGRLGPDMEVSIEYVEHIPKTPGGKFQAVVRQVEEPGHGH